MAGFIASSRLNASKLHRSYCLALFVFVSCPWLRAGPVNDDFSKAALLVGTSVRVSASNSGATKQVGEPDHVGDRGGASVWWTWTAPISGAVTITTEGSDFDTLLAVYSGDSLPALKLIASNDDEAPLIVSSAVTFLAQAGVNYRIAVDGLFDELPASGALKLSLAMAVPPRIESISPTANGGITIRFSGALDKIGVLEASEKLGAWVEVVRQINSTGTLTFSDDRVRTLHVSRFYRVREIN